MTSDNLNKSACDMQCRRSRLVVNATGTGISATRRLFLQSTGALATVGAFGVLAACEQRGAWARTWLYKYRVNVEVDGTPYELGNGGFLGLPWGGFYSPASATDLPMPSATRLPTGEVLVVFPPSLGGLIPKKGVSKPDHRYSEGAFPSVFIFDDGAKPSRAEGYLMRASQTGGDLRVKFLSVENEWTDTHEWHSIADALPWYAMAEQGYRVWVEEGDTAALNFSRNRPEALVHDGWGRLSPRPSPYAWIASLTLVDRGAKGISKPAGLVGPYAALGDAMARGETVHIPLALEGDLSTGALKWPTDPRVVRFRTVTDAQGAWAVTQFPAGRISERDDPAELYVQTMRQHFLPSTLGDFAFGNEQSERSDWWYSHDRAWRLTIGYRRVNLSEFATAGRLSRFGTGFHIIDS